MDKMNLVVFTVLLFCVIYVESARTFPKNISFGTGSSAYQSEGSWNVDGKSENIWDRWIHSDPSRIKNNDTADFACDSYTWTLMDADLARRLAVQHYRLSISWSRILPTGFVDKINMKAIIHYQEVIKNLQSFNITPVVTLYYHDLPQSLQDIGGWTNPVMAKYFADYARVCFQYFPDVEYWITFNDPRATCRKGYGEGTFAPGINSDGIGEYLCAYTILKGHAAAYHVYKEEFKDLNGSMSIAIDMMWSEPASADDNYAVERRNSFDFGLYANPIYKGNWPHEVIDRIDYRSAKENFTKSRLPKFTNEEINYIKGTSDFMAINMFYTHIVEDTIETEFGNPSYTKDMKAKVYLNSSWNLAVNGQPIVPLSTRKTLAWLSSSFNDPEIFITANGIPENLFNDNTRISYFRDSLTAILDAIEIDGVKVIGYTAWSLYDSFEWTDGYSYRFGFNLRIYDDNTVAFYSRDSFDFYRQFVLSSTIPEEITTTTTTSVVTTATTKVTTVPHIDTTPGSATKIVLFSSLILTIVFLFQILF